MADFIFKLEKRPLITTLILATLSVVSSYLIYKAGIVAGLAVMFMMVSVGVVLMYINNYRTAFYLSVVFAFFMFHLSRLLPASLQVVPLGAVVELLLALTAFAVVVHTLPGNDKVDKGMYNNSLAYALYIFVGFYILMLFHPASKGITGRIFALREIYAIAVTFFIAIHIFRTRNHIENFTRFWMFLALLAALYGMYQQYFGLQKWELDWLYLNPENAKLAMVAGTIRKWSFLSDINAFGLFMAYSAIIACIMVLGPFSLKVRAVFAICGLLMMVSMTFSGTRTATAMIVFGVVAFAFMTMYQMRTLIVTGLFVLGMLAILFGPFYGPTFSRIRSTFEIKDDESLGVRDRTRLRMQPYARTHPVGGGLNTTGKLGLKHEPNHELAGDWDPDSGYLKTALERGWIGLLIQLGFYATVMIFGIIHLFRSRDPWKQTYFLSYLAAFFALSIANYAQDSMDQKPVNLILVSSFAILIRLSLLPDGEDKPATALTVRGKEVPIGYKQQV
jgi:putative inorganic carbon (HCO3(-)) transporter